MLHCTAMHITAALYCIALFWTTLCCNELSWTPVCDKCNFCAQIQIRIYLGWHFWQIQIQINLSWSSLANTNICGSNCLDIFEHKYILVAQKGQIWIQIQMFRLTFANMNSKTNLVHRLNLTKKFIHVYTHFLYMIHNLVKVYIKVPKKIYVLNLFLMDTNKNLFDFHVQDE